MTLILRILDFAVVLLVVFHASRAVWKGPSGKSPSPILSVFVTAALLVFGMVSLSGASSLTTASAFHQGALLIFLAATAAVILMSRAKKPVA
jgi:hypothetical protein